VAAAMRSVTVVTLHCDGPHPVLSVGVSGLMLGEEVLET